MIPYIQQITSLFITKVLVDSWSPTLNQQGPAYSDTVTSRKAGLRKQSQHRAHVKGTAQPSAGAVICAVAIFRDELRHSFFSLICFASLMFHDPNKILMAI